MGGEAREMKKLNEMVIIKIYTSEKCIVYSCNLHPGEDSHHENCGDALRLSYGYKLQILVSLWVFRGNPIVLLIKV